MSRHACGRLVAVLSFTSASLIASNTDAQPQTGSVSGHVIAASTGQPVAGIGIEIFDVAGSSVSSASSGADGQFTAAGLVPGRYYARTKTSDYLNQLYWGVACAADVQQAGSFCDVRAGTPIEVVAGATTRFVDFSLQRGGHITGTVRTFDGALPLEGVTLWAENAFGRWTGVATTDATGAYAVHDLTPGMYGVRATRDGYVTAVFDGVNCGSPSCDPLAGTLVRVSAETTSQHIDFALHTGGRITGTVTDATTGSPIAGASVHVMSAGSSGDAVTGADGHYEISGLSPGQFCVMVWTPSLDYIGERYDDVPSPYPSCSSADGVVPVAMDATTSGIDFALLRGSRITGTLTDQQTGLPIAGVHVGLRNASASQNWIQDVVTDGTGAYAFTGLVAGWYFVHSYTQGEYVDELYDDVACVDDCLNPNAGTPVHVLATSTVSGIDLALVPYGRISGTVTSAATGLPIPALEMELSAGTAGFWRSAHTDTDGKYSFHGLTTGSYFVRSNGSAGGFVDQVFDGVPCPFQTCTPALGTAIGVTLSATTGGIDFALVPQSTVAGAISGSVVDTGTGQPIANVNVELLTSTGQYVRSTSTAASGAYTFADVPAGTYRVRTANTMSEFDYQDELFDNVPCPSGDCSTPLGAVVTVAAAITTDHVDFSLARAGHVSGTVTDASGQPIAGARVLLAHNDWSWQQSTGTSAEGTYLFKGVAPGSYYVRTDGFDTGSPRTHLDEVFDNVECPTWNCDTSRATPVVVTLSHTTADVDFSLRPAGRISGKVTDALTGGPLKGVSVNVRTASEWLTSAYLKDDGTYSVAGLVPGTYYLRTSNGSGYLDEAYDDTPCTGDCPNTTGTPITIDSGTAVTANFALLMGGRIAGYVTDSASGTSLDYVYITVYDATGSQRGTVATDSSGRYVITGLSAGPHFVIAGPSSEQHASVLYASLPCARGTCNPLVGTPVTVRAAATTDHIDFALAPLGNISGRITDAATGQPLAATWVFVCDAAQKYAGAALTEPDGKYAVESLQAGAYRVVTGAMSGYVDEVFDNAACHHGCQLASGADVTVKPFATTENVNFALDRGGQIIGTALDSWSGRLLSNVAIDVYDAAGVAVTRVVTSAEGTYATPGLAAGTYFLRASPGSGHSTQLFNELPCPAGTCVVTAGTPVTVTGTEKTTDIDFPLDCTVGVPSTIALSASAGSGTIDVTTVDPACTWSAVADPGAAWLTVSQGTFTGNRTLTCEATANSGPPRTATISIRGVPVTVTQDGATAFTYYLAEGATGDFFDLDVAIANPNDVDAPVSIRFLKDGAGVVPLTTTVGAHRRVTIRVDDVPGLESTPVSIVVTSTANLPLVVERTMFWDESHYGGHGEKAVSAPATRWYFAEGSQGFFDTYLLLANAGDEVAHATLQFLREGDTPISATMTIPANSRATLWAGSVAGLSGRAFSTLIDSDLPIIAERAMYFGTARFWDGGHDSAGVTSASTHWYLAEGATGPYFDTYVLVANPNEASAPVTFTFLRPDGVTFTTTRTVDALSRLTVAVEDLDPALANTAVSTTVTSPLPVVVERAMYWPGTAATWAEAHDSVGSTETGTRWGLAEGRSGGPDAFETYILVTNTWSEAADVKVTFLRTDGPPLERRYTVPPSSRFDVAVNAFVPELNGAQFGAIIESLNGAPLAVERAMYWNALGEPWAGGTNATAVRLPE